LRDHLGRELVVYNNGQIEALNLHGAGLAGCAKPNGSSLEKFYYVKDHLGSIRQTLDDNGDVKYAVNYWPYGDIIQEYSDEDSRYKFTERERDTETNYNYSSARYYSSVLGVWGSVDPLAGKYPGWSPYNYTLDNPLRFSDPNGKWPEEIHNKLIRKTFGSIFGEKQLRIKLED